MVDPMDAVMRALANKNTQWKKVLYFTVKSAQQKLSKYYTEVTTMTGLLLISAHILDAFWKLRLFRKWGKGMVLNSDDDGSYTMQYQEEFLQYVENEYCDKHPRLSVNKPE
jgi:hypothetical protein